MIGYAKNASRITGSRRSLPVVLGAFGVVPLLLASCGADAEEPEAGDGGELLYWSMWQESEPDAHALQEAIDEFEAATGITVTVEWHGRDVMDKLLAAQNTDDVPDVVNQSSGRVGAVMAANDQFTDLTSLYERNVYDEDVTIADVIDDDYASVTTAESGAPFMVPHFVHSYGLWYDAAALTDVAPGEEMTWEQFKQYLADSSETGQTPLALDADIGSYASAWPGIALTRAVGPGGLLELVSDPDAAGWDDPDVRAVITDIADFVAEGYFPNGYDSSKWPAIERRWFEGEADYLLMGSWVPLEADTKGWAPEGFELAVTNFPTIGEDASVPFDVYGFAIPKKAKNVEEAEEFIAFMLNKDVLSTWSSAVPLPPARTDLEVAGSLQGAYELMQEHPLSPLLDGMRQHHPDYYSKVFEPATRDLMIGALSGEEFLDQIKEQQIDYWKLQQ